MTAQEQFFHDSNVVSIKHGSSSNKNGEILEWVVKSFLIKKGYRENGLDTGFGFVCKHRDQQFKNLKNEIWELDIFLNHPKLWPIGFVIECKWKSSEGSIDEKIPYALLSLRKLPCPGMLLMAGTSYHPGIIEWAKSEVVMSNTIFVTTSIDEFLVWGQENL